MDKITGIFKYSADPDLKTIQTTMRALRDAGRTVSRQASCNHNLTFTAGHTETYPDIVNNYAWNNYKPAKLEFRVVSPAPESREIGRVTVHDTSGADMTFEMDEKMYASACEKLEGIATLGKVGPQ